MHCDIVRWSLRVLEEFFNQGDREKDEGLPVTPLCDRATTSLPASQINFLEFIVTPLFLQVCLFHLTSSDDLWMSISQLIAAGQVTAEVIRKALMSNVIFSGLRQCQSWSGDVLKQPEWPLEFVYSICKALQQIKHDPIFHQW